MTSLGTAPHLNSLPSDFSDVQPRSYDPQFISQISSKMQVPDRIKAVDGMVESKPSGLPAPMAAVSMQVPDRISLNDHNDRRDKLDRFDFTNRQNDYVGLMTPPRTLTMEEAFGSHAVEDETEVFRERSVYRLPNGDTHAPVPYTPGASMSDSLLHNEDDDATQLRTQVAKLSRRLTTLEQENQKRSTRELILYPIVMAYLFSKIFAYFFRWRN